LSRPLAFSGQWASLPGRRDEPPNLVSSERWRASRRSALCTCPLPLSRVRGTNDARYILTRRLPEECQNPEVRAPVAAPASLWHAGADRAWSAYQLSRLRLAPTHTDVRLNQTVDRRARKRLREGVDHGAPQKLGRAVRMPAGTSRTISSCSHATGPPSTPSSNRARSIAASASIEASAQAP
jgi:hypothetical protein